MPLIKFEGPDGPEELEVQIGPNGLPRLMVSEVQHIQNVAGMTLAQCMDGVGSLDPLALRALVQVMWKRQGRIVRFEEVDFDISTLAYENLPGEEEEDDGEAPTSAAGEDPTPASSGDATEAA